MLRLHDTLSGDLVDFVPREEGRVAMYVCGPTVYDAPHLGHARSALVFDVIRRYLMWRGFDVTFAMNVTDIDDKIIARAAKEATTEPALAAVWERVYFDQMETLDVLPADHRPRATEYIDGMTRLIAELVERDAAYVIEGSGVYFDVESFEGPVRE
ncbi:MAG TPA: class I tRNA ligase family protein, partial [Acidimicrobiia bacterium]|nr:class I tRNA ligase family protein [Acidimicrobiia bacterium]